MTKVKICGLTTYDDALAAAQAGADLLGFNFYKLGPRYIDPAAAQVICDRLRAELGQGCPVLVGIFVNATDSDISRISLQVGLDFVQLSGDESDAMIAELRGLAFKAIQPMTQEMALDDVTYYSKYFPTDERIPSILLDAYHPRLHGGTGEQASTDVALAVKGAVPRMMLAGGLNPQNVAGRVREIQPWGVDVASGVEPEDSPGDKDLVLIKSFIDAVRSVE